MGAKRYEAKIDVVTDVAKQMMPELPYHNFAHAVDVYSAVSNFANLAKIGAGEKFLLQTAALLHDVVLVPGNLDNEEMSAEFARKYLPKIGYSFRKSNEVGNLILATRMPQNPSGFLEEIICDADLDNLGRPDFFELGEKVREEMGVPGGVEWYKKQLEFLKGHNYHTEVARRLRDAGKEDNIWKLGAVVFGPR